MLVNFYWPVNGGDRLATDLTGQFYVGPLVSMNISQGLNHHRGMGRQLCKIITSLLVFHIHNVIHAVNICIILLLNVINLHIKNLISKTCEIHEYWPSTRCLDMTPSSPSLLKMAPFLARRPIGKMSRSSSLWCFLSRYSLWCARDSGLPVSFFSAVP